MNAYPNRKSYGFSLVELMVGIAIVGILATLAVPEFQIWFRNAQIRAAGESITNGLQRARAEAVAQNTNVEVVLGTEYVSGTGFVLCPGSSCWVVRVVSAPDPPIESRSGTEGSKNVTVNAWAADLTTPATTITFNNLGGVVAGAASLAQVDLAAAGGNQNLRVTIGVGGNARLCDPNLAPGSSPRAC